MKWGAIHDPGHPALATTAVDYGLVRVAGAAPRDPDWFGDWNWPATGDPLGNTDYSDCCEAADIVLASGFRASLGMPPLAVAELKAAALLRYEMVGGWDGSPATDNGTVTQEDCFAWASGPLILGGTAWRVKWATVPPDQSMSAIRRGPLLLTIGLTDSDKGDTSLWNTDPGGAAYTFLHRVVAGASKSGLLFSCRTWGRDCLVSPARVVAADLLVPVDMPASLVTAGLNWDAVS
jgi:hypothetical protein